MIIDINKAKELLDLDKVIAIPTDTVYGLAASIKSEKAVSRIFELKGRSFNKPLILLASKLSQIEPFLIEKPEDFEKLAGEFWPGALTLVLPADTSKISPKIRAGLQTVGFRIPNCSALLSLLDEVGPLATTSANISDKESAISADQVEECFGRDFPILESEQTVEGTASTVMEYKNRKWHLLRPGPILPFGF